MIRFLVKLALCLFVGAAAALAFVAVRSGDPVYTVYEWISPARFQRYDPLIETIGTEHHIDPMLIKAVVWRESWFDPQKYGSAGERGLMQVMERTAGEWARETHVGNFQPEELFDPKMNLEAGAWVLHQALQHWRNQAEPIPFALAEYNAGFSRAQRWAGGEESRAMASGTFRRNIDFPGTRKYVDSIIQRYKFYKKRGRM